jgi:O-antigen/teichoic acid export membrane protein
MNTIRRQSILSSGVVYIGFAVGAISNYVMAREFNPDQYGLVNGMFVAIGTIMSFFRQHRDDGVYWQILSLL